MRLGKVLMMNLLFAGKVLIGDINASAVQNLQNAIDSGMAESLAASNGVTIEAVPEKDPNEGKIESTDEVAMKDAVDQFVNNTTGMLGPNQ